PARPEIYTLSLHDALPILESFTGYTVIFGISLGLFTGAVVLSFFLKRRSAEGDFVFRRIIAERKNNSNWKNILNAHFFQGIREGTFVFVKNEHLKCSSNLSCFFALQ